MDLSIGALAKATGVPANTLRTWERRYGFPEARRTAGGQRVYAPDTVDRVRLVARAIELGHRPAQIVLASVEELRALAGRIEASQLEASRIDAAGVEASTPSSRAISRLETPLQEVDAWVHAAAALDGDALDRAFRARLARVGMEAFLSGWAGPFLVAVGEAWASGDIHPFHEHFASERLREFLVSLWRPLSESNQGPVAVCATMPSERHSLGLHMAACLASAAGWRVVFLGAETPLPDIDACARQSGARAVLVSVSSASSPVQVTWDLAVLRSRLPHAVRLVVGGAGAPPLATGSPDDARWDRLDGLEMWLAQSRAAESGAGDST